MEYELSGMAEVELDDVEMTDLTDAVEEDKPKTSGACVSHVGAHAS